MRLTQDIGISTLLSSTGMKKLQAEEFVLRLKMLWNNFHKEERVVPACRKSVENLGLDYVDLYLMHWPFAYQDGDDLTPTDETGKLILADIDYLETWRGMEECQRLGLTKSIGISNFNSEQITRLLSVAKIKPVNNQIEVNLNLPQKRLIEFCKKHDITVTGFSPLARPGNRSGVKIDLGNEKVLGLAKKYNKTPQQIALRFVFQCGAAVIPKSVTKSRIVQNIQIFDFELTAEEMSDLDSKATGERVSPMKQTEGAKYYPFSIPF
ncbi:1,5-anhydro-D-fructose reductase isoform X2 [Cephus cinctus]|uniref:1,5-anhydro-D-fructose reductase isoform X2 n=1 Tax=Cephus cinctus TaxID=211228 RepID=A0AAJ7FQ90_CEPCN|nr:1,5-anhydro-D-fructose reductase isoform X2 [Cephus cinctus]XP_015602931.1 1,5-anhydro-D-fructose reductase isoform X2 [Cephus cinctus]